MDSKPSRSSAVPPPANISPGHIHSARMSSRIDTGYFISIPSHLKIVEIIVGIVCAAVCGKAYFSGNEFFLFVTILFIILTTVLLFLHFARIPKIVTLPAGIKWAFVEFVYATTAAVFYAIAASVQVARTVIGECYYPGWAALGCPLYARYLAAGIIAFLNMGLYAADAFVHYRQYRNNQVQGPV